MKNKTSLTILYAIGLIFFAPLGVFAESDGSTWVTLGIDKVKATHGKKVRMSVDVPRKIMPNELFKYKVHFINITNEPQEIEDYNDRVKGEMRRYIQVRKANGEVLRSVVDFEPLAEDEIDPSRPDIVVIPPWESISYEYDIREHYIDMPDPGEYYILPVRVSEWVETNSSIRLAFEYGKAFFEVMDPEKQIVKKKQSFPYSTEEYSRNRDGRDVDYHGESSFRVASYFIDEEWWMYWHRTSREREAMLKAFRGDEKYVFKNSFRVDKLHDGDSFMATYPEEGVVKTVHLPKGSTTFKLSKFEQSDSPLTSREDW